MPYRYTDFVGVRTHTTKCSRCGCEMPSGTHAYNIDDEFYCDSCWEQHLEEYSQEHEIETEDWEEIF